jgi:uncharacterized membrane protein
MINTDHLHPMIVHFPIALIVFGFIAEVVSLFFRTEKCLSRTGFYLMLTGTLAAIAAWSTGQLFANAPGQGDVVTIFEIHETGGLITMIVMIVCSIFRSWLVMKKKEESALKWISFGFYFAGCTAVLVTGYMGGIMVYDFMLKHL